MQAGSLPDAIDDCGRRFGGGQLGGQESVEGKLFRLGALPRNQVAAEVFPERRQNVVEWIEAQEEAPAHLAERFPIGRQTLFGLARQGLSQETAEWLPAGQDEECVGRRQTQ